MIVEFVKRSCLLTAASKRAGPAVVLATGLLAFVPQTFAQGAGCRVAFHQWAYKARVDASMTAAPGASCAFGYRLRDGTGGGVDLKEVRVVERPQQGRIEYSSQGRAQFTYVARAGAAGSDAFTLRFEVRRLDRRSGLETSSDWFEVRYSVSIVR